MSVGSNNKRAVVLLSGGLDSATCLAIATNEGYECYAISCEYGQRSVAELNAAKKLCEIYNVKQHYIATVNLTQIGGSALTDHSIDVPEEEPAAGVIPITYVPARNTIFLSLALGYAESVNASDFFIGVNHVDYSNYPDCRPEYLDAFAKMADLATRAGVEGQKNYFHAPLLEMSKAEIIKTGTDLGLDYSITVSCYQADKDGQACRKCSSCLQRAQGFHNANISDSTRYQ